VTASSILGQTGDFPTAAGLRLAAAVLAIERAFVPGTVGFREPDPAAPVPGLVAAPREGPVGNALVCAHATGGAEVAVVLQAQGS
jgi:3-oxoacyl-(acyl-carrier-protein) synthase